MAGVWWKQCSCIKQFVHHQQKYIQLKLSAYGVAMGVGDKITHSG
jgi:hypothetical protein